MLWCCYLLISLGQFACTSDTTGPPGIPRNSLWSLKYLIFTFCMLSINTDYIDCWAYLCFFLGPNRNSIDCVELLFHGKEGFLKNQIKYGLR